MTSCKLNLTSKTYFGQGLANILKVWKCKNHFLDFRVSWREDCTGWLCDGRCELLSLVGNLRSHLTCLHTPHTTHYTCLHKLPCPTSGQPTAGTENWKSILYKSGDFSFQVFKNKQNTKWHSVWKSHSFAERWSTKKSPKQVRRFHLKGFFSALDRLLNFKVEIIFAYRDLSPNRPYQELTHI